MRRFSIVLLVLALACGGAAAQAAVESKPKPRPKPCKVAKGKPKPKKCPAAKEKAAKPKPRPVAPAPPPPAPPPPPPAPLPSSVTIGPAVPAGDAELIRNGVAIGEAFYKKIGAPGAWRYDVFVEHDLEAVIATYVKLGTSEESARRVWSGGTTAAAGNDYVLVWTGQPNGWTNITPAQKQKVLVHELFHTLQNALLRTNRSTAPPDQIPAGGPTWLREGSAEFMGYYAIADAGIGSFGEYRDAIVRDAKRNAVRVTLPQLGSQREASQHGYAAYSLGLLATDLLVQQKGLGAVIEFYRQVGDNKPWQAAFTDVFGRSVDAFYAEFESYRQTL